MPKFALRGFPSGPVRLKVAQDQFSDEKSFSLGDETGGMEDGAKGSVTLIANRMVGTAPAGFFFSAIAEDFDVDDAYFDVRYKWTFSDPGHYTRHDTADLPWGKYYDVDGEVVLVEDGTVPQGTNVTFLGNDKDVAFGPHVCHVFERPGVYEVTCEVQKPGEAEPIKLDIPPLEILVEDAEDHFVGPATICVSPSGNFEGAPERALRVNTFAEAMALASQAASSNIRILLHRGETHFTPDSRSEREPKGDFKRLFYGAYGTGAPPVYGPNNLFTKGEETAVYGLDNEGGYDPSDPWLAQPESKSPIGRGGMGLGQATHSTVWDCKISGGKDLIGISTNSSNVIIGNTYLSNWHNYGIYAGQGLGTSGFCGVWIKQHPDTVIGGEGKFESEAPFYQDHGPFRCSSLSGPVAFNLCDLRSIGSWAGYFQPCLRIGRSPNDPDVFAIEEAVMDRMRGENGGMLGTGNSGKVAYPRRYLWDKIYLVRSNSSASIFNPGISGLQWRNVIVVIPNTPKIGGGVLNKWVWRGTPDKGAIDDPSIAAFGIRLYNSTLVDLRDGTNYNAEMILWDAEDLAGFGEVTIGNNIIWIPNRPGAPDASTGDKDLELTPLWRPTYKGMRYREDPFAPIYGTPEDTAAYYRPLPNSAAYQKTETAMPVAVDDFFGRVRGASPSRGAIEPLD